MAVPIWTCKDKSNWFHFHLTFKQIESCAFCLISKLGKKMRKGVASQQNKVWFQENNVTHGPGPHIMISHSALVRTYTYSRNSC